MKDSSNLDLLRAFAVVLVVLSHMPDVLGWNWNTWTMGHLGVALFFVHTTLVLMMSLERHGPDALPFYVRRIFRIYPLAMATVLLFTLFMWLGDKPLTVAEFASNMLLLQQVTGHWSYPPQLWTLPYELAMYLMLPAIFVAARAGRSVRAMAAIYMLGLAPAMLLWALSIEKVWSLSFIPCFLPGAIAFLLAKRVHATVSPLVLGAVVVTCAVAIPPMVAAGWVTEMPLLWVMCLLVGVTIPFCRDVTLKPLPAIGAVIARYSYGIYLTHVLAINFTLAAPGVWYVQVLRFFLLQAVLTLLAYRLIEAPGIRLGVRLAAKTPTASPLASRALSGTK